MCTAMRRGECCLLKWQDVDLADRFVNIKTSKTGQPITIPIFPMLYDELTGRKAEGEYVFPEQAAVYRHNGHGITRRVRKVLERAGFVDEKAEKQTPDLPGSARGPMHAERPTGLYRASIRDFHSFRVTWVTLALTAGVPLELVTKVTGHQTTAIVLKHNFQPGREDFRRALPSAMPELLTNGHSKSPLEQAREIANASTAETAWRDVQTIRQILKG